MPLRAPWECRGRSVSFPYRCELFTVGTFGDTRGDSRAAVITVYGTGFDPGEQLPPGKYRPAAELLVRDRIFVNEIVERRPRGGYALFGQEPGGGLNGHSVSFDGLVFAPEVGEFRKNCGNLVGDDSAQLLGSCEDNGFGHDLCVVFVKHWPASGLSERSRHKGEKCDYND